MRYICFSNSCINILILFSYRVQYEESGKHSKGHSTKGSHDIHKKDEYEKKVEFFEEEGDAFEDEADGGHHKERERKSVN